MSTPGPILSISGSVEQLRDLREKLRVKMGEARVEISNGQTKILEDQQKFLKAGTEADKDAIKERQAAQRTAIAAQRAEIAVLQEKIRQYTTQIPSKPLSVNIEGVGGEALGVIREELGVLLGPLNGVTGRISTLISLFKDMSHSALESTGAAATGLGEEAMAAGGASEAVAVLGGSMTAVIGIATGAAAAFAIVVGGLFEAGKATSELAHNYEQLGTRIGASGEEIQGLKLVAETSGTSVESLVMGLSRLSFALTGRGTGGTVGEDGVEGSSNRVKAAVETLIGTVKKEDGTFLSTTDILKRTADQFKVMPDGVVKASLAMEMFGFAGSQLIPVLNKGGASIQELIDTANRLGISLDGQSERYSAYEEATGKLGLAWDSLKQVFGDTGVFDAVTASINAMAEAIGKLTGASDRAAGRKIGDEIAATLEKGGLKGAGVLTKKGLRQIRQVGNLIGQTSNNLAFSTTGAMKQSEFTPEQIAGVSREFYDLLAESKKKFTDQEERSNYVREKGIEILKELISVGMIEEKTDEEIAQGQEALKKGQEAAGGEVFKFRTEWDKLNQEVQKANDKYGLFGTTVGAVSQKATVSVAAMKAELQALMSQGAIAKATGEIPDNIQEVMSRIKELTQEIPQAEQAQKQLNDQMEKTRDDFAKAAEKVVDLHNAQFGLTETVNALSNSVQLQKDKFEAQVGAINALIPPSQKQADAFYALGAAMQQSGVDSKPFLAALQTLLTMVPATKDNDEAAKALIQTLQDLTEHEAKLDAATTKASEAQTKQMEAVVKLFDESTKLNKQIAEEEVKQAKILEKDLTPSERFDQAALAITKETNEIAKLKEQMVGMSSGTKEYKDLQDKLYESEKNRTTALGELHGAQEELKKSTISLGTVWGEFSGIIGQFSGGLPQTLVRITALIEGFNKLTSLLTKLNASGAGPTGGILGGALGTIGKIFGIGGKNFGLGPGESGGLPITPADYAGGGGSAALGKVAIGAGIGSVAGGALGGGFGQIGGAAAGAGLTAMIMGVGGALGPIGLIAGAGLAAFGAIRNKMKKKTAELAASIGKSFNQITDSLNNGGITLTQAIQQQQVAMSSAISQLSGKKGGKEQLAQLLPQMQQQIAALQAKQRQIFEAFNADLGILRLPENMRDMAQSLNQVNQRVKEFVDAGGDAATAAEFLSRSMENLRVSTQKELTSSQQSVINDMLQEIDLTQQLADLTQQRIDLELQRTKVVLDAQNQILGVQNQGIESKSLSMAQQKALQIRSITQQQQSQLDQIDKQETALDKQKTQLMDQLALTEARIAGQNELFGLELTEVSLHQRLLDIEIQLGKEQAARIAALQEAQGNELVSATPETSAPPAQETRTPRAYVIGDKVLTPSQLAVAMSGVNPFTNKQDYDWHYAALSALPVYKKGGIQTEDGLAFLHAKEGVLPASLTTMLTDLSHVLSAHGGVSQAIAATGGNLTVGDVQVNVSAPAGSNPADIGKAVSKALDEAFRDMQRRMRR